MRFRFFIKIIFEQFWEKYYFSKVRLELAYLILSTKVLNSPKIFLNFTLVFVSKCSIVLFCISNGVEICKHFTENNNNNNVLFSNKYQKETKIIVVFKEHYLTMIFELNFRKWENWLKQLFWSCGLQLK